LAQCTVIFGGEESPAAFEDSHNAPGRPRRSCHDRE
jgi:hypothetical protein